MLDAPTLRDDVLLKEVSDAFARLATLHLPPFLALLPQKTRKELQAHRLVRHLLLLQWRSRDVLNEFADFYCVRLLLDDQSPLATYFIDLFSQLEWVLQRLKLIDSIQHRCHELLRSMWPAIQTCRLLYAAYRMLPRSTTLDEQRVAGAEFKREGRHRRRFLWNELHCRIRGLGFVNLDRQGPSMVCLSAQLGEGGFATVYRGDFKADDENGRTIQIGDPVAVKMFSNGKSDSTTFSSRLWQSMEHITQHHEQSMTHNCGITEDDPFSSELRRLVSVRHPNIVTPRGYIGKRPQGESGLVMELMDESLHDHLEKVNSGGVPPLQELDMLDLMLEIAKGMRFLHECNLIHRDLKPKNVLLRFCRDRKDQGCKILEVKLADFGLTKLCDFAQARGSTMYRQTSFQGTSCYMAPELRGHTPLQESPYQVEKVDVFSYGTTCFNILICNPDALYFSAQSVDDFYEAVKTGEWKQWVQGIDEHLHYIVKLIAKCWEFEPARRPTFAALCALLQHAMECVLVPGQLSTALFFKVPFGELQYSEVYRSIIEKCLYRAVGGVKVIKKCFLDFESTHSNRLLAPTNKMSFGHKLQQMTLKVARWILSGTIHTTLDNKTSVHLARLLEAMRNAMETSDFARDINLSLEAMRKGHFQVAHQGLTHLLFLKPPKRPTLRLCEYMNNCLDYQDPLHLIKGLACCNLAIMYDNNNNIKVIRSLLSIYEEYIGFDFKSDEAFCELEVDESLIPFLVMFWLPDFGSYDETLDLMTEAGTI